MDLHQEQLLVKQAQNGDQQALSQLWEALTPKLFGYLVNSTHNKILAEDLLQATWLKAIQALPNFENRGIGISAWLFAIARNECRQNWRNAKPEVELSDEFYDQPASENNHDVENKMLVEQIMNLLPADDRELLRLRFIADLPLNDIAKILNINFVAVRVRLHRALKRAKKIINSKL